MESLAFAFPLTPCQVENWRDGGKEILGPRRSEYQAFRRRLGLGAHRMYLQHTAQGDTAIMYLEGDDLQRTFQQLRTSQDPFIVWFRQLAKNLLDGFDLIQTSLGSLSKLIFDGPGVAEDEAWHHAMKVMERIGMISP